MSIDALEWRDRPSLIERLLPAQKISAEAQKGTRKAGAVADPDRAQAIIGKAVSLSFLWKAWRARCASTRDR